MARSWPISAARVCFGVLAAMVVASALVSPAFAQKKSGPPSFLLGTVAGDPGTTASIPLYFTPGEGQPVHSVHLEVVFVSNSVKFDKADKGTAAAVQDFTMTVDSKELPTEQNLQHTKL